MQRSRITRASVAAGTTILGVAVPASVAGASHGLPYHWDRNTPIVTAKAQVYYEDHTGSRWHVNAETVQWYNYVNAYVLPFYTSATGCNHSTLHCVPVYEYNDNDGFYGYTTYTVGANNHINQNSMTVKFNDNPSTTQAQRDSIVCHELGHGLGPLGESYAQPVTSCMTNLPGYFPLTPDSHDVSTIAGVYNH
jgi:hypothetical protein